MGEHRPSPVGCLADTHRNQLRAHVAKYVGRGTDAPQPPNHPSRGRYNAGAPKGRGLAARIIARDLLALRDAEDGVAVALPRPPHGAQLVDDSMVEPDQTPTLFVGLVLEFILPSGSVELFTSYASTVVGILITARVTGGDGLADFSAGRTRCNPRGHPTAMALRKMRGSATGQTGSHEPPVPTMTAVPEPMSRSRMDCRMPTVSIFGEIDLARFDGDPVPFPDHAHVCNDDFRRLADATKRRAAVVAARSSKLATGGDTLGGGRSLRF